jgi:metal-responsive CopG/Arc/MetJ family transcriptional regulator
MALLRITVTIPAPLVRDADRRARRDDRSRSWVVADALRRYLAGGEGDAPVAHTEASVFVAAAERARTQHIEAEQTLTPSARLARAEALSELAREQQGRGTREQVIAFDSYDDFNRWKKARLIGA